MKSNPTISMISGNSVPFNISYFPSVLPRDEVVLQDYVPMSSSQSLDGSFTRESSGGQFDRSTQTSFRYAPFKNTRDRSLERINQLNDVSFVEDNNAPSSLPPYTHSSDGERDNLFHIGIRDFSSSRTPLMRSASYEKAIMSSMKDIEFNIKCESKVMDHRDTDSSYAEGSITTDVSATSALSPSSNKTHSGVLPHVTEVFSSKKESFDKWMQRASLKKSDEEDKEMKLLKHEQVDTSVLSEDEHQENHSEEKLSSIDKDDKNLGDVKQTNYAEDFAKNESEASTLVLRKDKTDTKDDKEHKKTTTNDNAIIVVGVVEKVNNNNNKTNKDNEDKNNKQDDGKSISRKSSRAEAMLKKSYSCYPEGGGGGSEYPYLREMKERLLIAKDTPLGAMDDPSQIDAENQLLEVHHTPVGTVVKLNADGYGSHTSPTHRVESFYTGTLESRKTNVHEFYPKNAKTSSFITLSMLYATLLVVVCLGFVLSEVLTHNVPLYYYEAFFTYLYGFSILFLLYVFCYLLSGSSREPGPPKNQVFMVRLSMLSLVTRTLTRSSSFLTRFCRPFQRGNSGETLESFPRQLSLSSYE